MTIQEFHIDLREAAVQGRYSRLHNIKTGEYDGSISFTFSKPEEGVSVDLQAIVSGMQIPIFRLTAIYHLNLPRRLPLSSKPQLHCFLHF